MTAWWKQVHCPYCQAPPGQHCVSKTGRPVTTHVERHTEGAYAVFEGFAYEDDEDEYNEMPEYPTYAPRHMITVYLPGDAPHDRDLEARRAL